MGKNLVEIYRRADKVSSWVERTADRAVGVVSEKARAQRAHNRLLGRDESYSSAWHIFKNSGKRSTSRADSHAVPWLALSNRDADGDQIPLLEERRQKSRFIEKRDGIGAGIFGSRQRKVIGSGLRLQVRSGDDDDNDAWEEVWNERKDLLYPAEGGLSHAAGQRMIFGRRDVDGDISVCPTISAQGEPIWFEAVESDRTATPIDAVIKTGHRIVEGVEKDALGVTVAYHIHKRHPGEVFLSPWSKGFKPVPSRNRDAFVRIDASRCKMLRRGVTRPGQSRGLPLLHAVDQDIHGIDLLVVSTLKRAQIAACLTLFITSDASIEDLFPDSSGKTTEEPWGYEVGESLKPGEFFRLAAGEKIQPTGGMPVAPDLEPFVWLFARRIGAAVGRSPQSILGDWSGVNYSGARTIMLEDRISDDLERKDFSNEFLDWQVRLVWSDAIRRGDSRLARFTVDDAMKVKTRWVGDARRWVDPVKEGKAIELALDLNLTTLEFEAASLGGDWKENMIQRAKEKEFAESLGLTAGVEQLPGTPPANEPASTTPPAGRALADVAPTEVTVPPVADVHSLNGNGVNRIKGILDAQSGAVDALGRAVDALAATPAPAIPNFHFTVQQPAAQPAPVNNIRVEPQAAAPAPVTHVHVDAPVIQMSPEIKAVLSVPPRKMEVKRDSKGQITGAESEEA